MSLSLSSLRELLNNSTSVIQSNEYFGRVLEYSSSSYGFLKEHKAEVAGASVAGFVAWYLA